MSRRTDSVASAYSRRVVEAIKLLRAKAGLSNAELIRDAGFSVNYFYVRLRGEAPFDTNDLDRIARALRIEVQDITQVAASILDTVEADDSVLLDGVELARRLRYLTGVQSTRPEVDGVTPAAWELLLAGMPQVAAPQAVLVAITERFAVNPEYLTNFSSKEIVARVEAELELSRALQDVGATPIAARALGGLAPSALLAVAESIRSIASDGGKR